MTGSIQGIYVPTATPFKADGSLNESELRRIISWLIDNGVSGIYPNGSMGEFIRLTFEERKELIRIIADEVDGRVPILAGAAEPNTDLVLEMCHHCADLGCRAVSITGPYYYNPSQQSIETYFRQLAQKSPIDIVLYNIPAFAAEISVPVIERLALDCPRIVGTKDSSTDMCRFLHTMNAIKPQRPEFSILVGWEELLVPSLMMGGDGGTLSTAGVAPEAIMRIFKESVHGNWSEARRLQYKLLELFQTMLQAANFPTGFRLGYEARGFDIGHARYPNSPDEENSLIEIAAKIACLLGECGLSGELPGCKIHGFSPKPLPEDRPHATDSSIDLERIVEEVIAQMKR